MYKAAVLLAASLALSCSCFSQSAIFSFDSGNAAPGGSVILNVSLSSPAGSGPAALGWTVGYPAASIASVAATAGPSAVAGGKSVSCASSAGLYTCLVSGMNQNAMANGVIASLAFVLTPAAATMPISLSNTIGAMGDGTSLAVTPAGGTITVTAAAQPNLSTLNCSPASVTGGNSSTCTVGISMAAPAGGAVVSLSSNNSAATVPASVTIPAGAMSAPFTASTIPVAANQSVTIAAGYGGASLTTSLAVTPVVTAATGLQCNLPGGTSFIPSLSSAVCTITLASPAIASQPVALSSSAAYLTVPASVIVPAGAVSANFTINAGAITTGMNATITAATGGVSKTLTLSVFVAVSSVQCNSATLSAGSSATCTVTLGQTELTDSPVALSTNSAALTVPHMIVVPAGAISSTFTASAAANAAYQMVSLTAMRSGYAQNFSIAVGVAAVSFGVSCTPQILVGGSGSTCTVTLAGAAPAAGASVSLSSNNAVLSVPASVTIAPGTASATVTASSTPVAATQSAILTASYGGGLQTAALTVTPPVLSKIQCVPVSVLGGSNSTCTVTLSGTAPAGGASVSLSANNPAVSVPGTVSVPAGASSVTVSVSTTSVAATQAATITASYAGALQTALLTVMPATLSSIRCVPASVSGGSSSTCTATLLGTAPAGGASVSLSANNPAVSVPGAVSVPAGASSVTVSVSTTSVATTQSATITASYAGVLQTASLSVQPPTISSHRCAPATVLGGSSSTCTVTLSGAAPTGGSVVSLSSINSAVTVPASLTIPGGVASATFSASTIPVAVSQSAAVTASFSGASQTALVAVVPAIPVTGLQCNLPGGTSFIPSLSSAVCTITLASPALASQPVALSSSAAYLTVPASVIVPAGAVSANFTINAGAITTGMNATITATTGGVSKALTLSVFVAVSSVQCSPATLPAVLPPAVASTTCTVTLGQTELTASPVALSTNSAALTVPHMIVVPAGAISSTFAATVAPNAPKQQVTITASRTTYSVSFLVTIGTTSALTASAQISAVTCGSSNLTAGGSASCGVELTEPARIPTRIRLSADDAQMNLPTVVEVQPGNSRANFVLKARPEHRDSVATILAAADQSALSLRVPVTGIRPLSLSCSPKLVQAGGTVTCELRLNSSDVEDPVSLDLSSSEASLKLPSSVATRPRQSTLSFQAVTDQAAASQPVSIRAAFGAHTAQDDITVQAGPAPLLKVPGRLAVRSGSQLSFEVTASSSSGLPLRLSSGVLPEGAAFDPDTSRFTWTPADSQRHQWDLVFTATDLNNASASAHAIVDVDLGQQPVIRTVVNAATGSSELVCAPGSLASIHGRWLSAGTASDPIGRQFGAFRDEGPYQRRVRPVGVCLSGAGELRLPRGIFRIRSGSDGCWGTRGERGGPLADAACGSWDLHRRRIGTRPGGNCDR